MAQPQNETLKKIREYSEEARGLQDDVVDFDASSTEARLEQTVKELQARVQEQQAALDKLRSRSQVDIESAAYASEDPRKKLQQLIAVKDAYRRLNSTATYLPAPGSVLPALLAARTLQQNIKGTKDAITSTQSQLDVQEPNLRQEEALLHDAQLLSQSMENRIERLRSQHEDRSQKTPAQLARELIAAKRAKKESYDKEMQRMGGAMNDFINDYLSSMLAAEELGGPVVGDMLDVEDDTLAAGIDQIWGKKTAVDDQEEEEEPPTEAEAADAEMRQLIENLFATLIGPGGGKAYFQLQRDSAASRFLVRAKIAQFHPKDARKLRLIDFGRELDD
ncbi:unnamed protein product [Alternaria alternata]